MRQTAVVIVFTLAALSFVAGMNLAATLYEKVAPSWVFGEAVAKKQGIRVVENARHYLRFSNDPRRAVPKGELGGLNFISGVSRIVLVIGLFYGSVFAAAFLARRSNPDLAQEILRIAKPKGPENK